LKSREVDVKVTAEIRRVSCTVPVVLFCVEAAKVAPPLINPACAVAPLTNIAEAAIKPRKNVFIEISLAVFGRCLPKNTK
jgi:hypothetical protein